MEQVILDHSYFDHQLSREAIPIDKSLLSEGLLSLFGKFPNFIKEENVIISHRSFYYRIKNAFFLHYGTLINGKDEGYRLTYYYDGIINSVGRYRDGKKEGIWQYYDRHGNLEKEEFYRNKIVWILKDEETKLIY